MFTFVLKSWLYLFGYYSLRVSTHHQLDRTHILQSLSFIKEVHKCSTGFSQKMLAGFISVPILQMLEMRLRCPELLGFELGFSEQACSRASGEWFPDQQGILSPSPALLSQNLGLGGRAAVLVMLVHTLRAENHCQGQHRGSAKEL